MFEPKEYKGCSDQYFGHITVSQHGEDLMFLNIFRLLKIEKPNYLDIGANHPVMISNTALLYARGSRGVNVEANPNCYGEFLKYRPEDVNLNVGVAKESGVLPFYMIDATSGLNSFCKEKVDSFLAEHPKYKITEVKEIEVTTISSILRAYFNDRELDLLTIDVEGLDYEILETMPFGEYRPKVICIERWPWESQDTINLLCADQRYNVLCRMGANLIFVRSDLINALLK